MKRYFVVIIVNILFSLSNLHGQPIDQAAYINTNKELINAGDCYQIIWSFPENAYYLKDCPQYDDIELWKFKLIKVDCGLICNMVYNIMINGQVVKTGWKFDDEIVGNFFLENYIKDEIAKGNHNLEVKITMATDCMDGTSKVDEVIRNIEIIGKGDSYSKFYYIDQNSPQNWDDCKRAEGSDLFKKSLTCYKKGPKTISMGYETKEIKTNGNIGETTVTVGFNFFGVPATIEQSFQIPTNFYEKSTYFGVSSAITLQPPTKEGKCVFAAVTVTHDHYREMVYENDCNPEVNDKFIGSQDYYIPINFGLVQCAYDPQCTQVPNVKLKYQRKSNIINRSNCSGTLIAEAKPIEEVNYYTWTLPDGTTFDGDAQIEINEPGLYKCVVSNICGQKSEVQFNNCTNTSYSPWRYDPGTKMYCRQVTCQCGEVAAFRESSTYNQCITPDRYDGSWNFDNGKKKCTKHAYWTDQDGNEIDLTSAVSEEDILARDENVVKEPAGVIEYYDEWSKKCVREYRCDDNSPGYEEEQEPNYGEWQYDDWSENCYREVFCFGGSEPAKDQDGWEVSEEAEGEVNWEFQEDDLTCYGTVYCGNNETDIELEIGSEMEWYWNEGISKCKTETIECNDIEQENEVSEDPADIGEWEYDDFWEICVRDVYCETADETYEDTYFAAYSYDENNYADCDEENGEFSYRVYCGTETDIYICRNVPPDPLASGQNHLTPNNKTTTSVNKLPDNIETKYKYYRIHVFSIDGRDRKIESVKNVSDVDNYINFFKKYRAQKNIKYFYSVYGENNFLYTKRFVIFK